MKFFVSKICSACLLATLFCSSPLFGSGGVFDCDPHKLNIVYTYIDPHLCALQTSDDPDEFQEALYKSLIKVRNGEVVKGAEHENLITLIALLPLITTTHDNLDDRAALNLANAKYYLAKRASAPREAGILYQDAYYIYSLLAQRSGQKNIREFSDNNMQKLLNQGKIRLVTPTQISQEESLMLLIEEGCDESMGLLESMMQGLPEDILSSLEEQGILIDDITREGLLRKLKGHNEEAIVEEKENLKKHLLEENMSISMRKVEEQNSLTNPIPDIELTEKHLFHLSNLLGQIILCTHNTPLTKGRPPLIVPIGRSVSWIVKLWEKLPLEDLNVEIPPILHILASGLAKIDPTDEQKEGYKGYLDDLGFRDYMDYEILFLDVSETGGTFRRMQALIEELYPALKNHTQNIALLYDGITTDLPQTRVCYMSQLLREPMFAKHGEKQYYCPFPTFYPEDWESDLVQFPVPKGAMKFEDTMDRWVKEGGYSKIFLMLALTFE